MREPRFAVYALFLALLTLLSFLAYQAPALPGDSAIGTWLQDISLPFFTFAMRAVSYLGRALPAAVSVALIVLILLLARRRLEAVFVIALPALAGLVNNGLKVLVDRPRPDGYSLEGALSFPSGHATYAMVLGGLVFYLAPRLLRRPAAARALQVLMGAFIILIGVSRVHLEAHWPSDVLGSYLLGGLLLAPAIVLYNRIVTVTARRAEVEDARAS